MRTLFILTFVFFHHQNVMGQLGQGAFISNNNYFLITKDTIQFEFETNSALIIRNRGVGVYEVIDKYLIIRTIDYPGLKSRIIDSTSLNSDSIKIQVNTHNMTPNILGQSAQGKTVKSYTLNENSELTISKVDKVESVIFSTIGYDPLTIKLQKGKKYNVEIVEGVTIENLNLAFTINELNHDSINLTLLDIKAEKDEIGSIKTLNKLKRKKGHFTFWTQTLKKK